MKMRRKKLIASSQVETVWNAQGVSSGPSYEAFTIPTPRGLSTIGTPVDSSLTGHKRPASDAEQSHTSASSFGTLLQVEQGDINASHSLVGSARPSQQGVKQIVLRLSGLRQSPATSGEPSSVKYGEPVLNMGTQAESQHETMWSNATECIENRQNDHMMNSTCPELQSSGTVRALHPPLQMQEMKENIKLGSACCGDDSGGCMGNLDKSCCVQDSFPHPTNPSWILNANVCKSSCCISPSLNNQTVNPCNACAATRFTTFQPGVSRAVHYISGEDVMVCPAPWVHEGRDESYHMPDPVYPPGHCNDDLDMETQRHLEEQIAQEILLLSQKLANLQARYGARRPVHNNTKQPAVLSCPPTPLLLDITRRDVKSNPRAPSASRIKQPESRCQLEERKLGAGRTNMKAASSTTAQSSNRGSDSGVQTSFNKNHKSLPGPGLGNTTTVSRSQNGCQPNELTQGCEYVCIEVGKPSRTFSSPHRKRRDRETEEHVDECCYSDDMKNFLKEEQNVRGYPNGSKRFDWVKTLRIAGVRENNQGCSDFAQVTPPGQECDEPECLSKSVQTGGASAEDRLNDARTPEVLEERLKISSSTTEFNWPGKNYGNKFIEEMGGLDSRNNSLSLKAGLRRAPGSLWKTGGPVRNALRVKKKTFGSRSPRKDGGKRLRSRTRTLLDLNFKAYSAKDEKFGQLKERQCEEGVDGQWQSEVADCEAEYETFVENTDVGGGCEEDRTTSIVSREEVQEEESQNRISTVPEVKTKLSEAPVLSLMKGTPHHAPKKTFIRCIDLVVASNNMKKINQLSKLNGRCKPLGVRYSYRSVDGYGLEKACQLQPQINEGVVCQNIEAAVEQCLNIDDRREPDPSSTMDTQESLLQSKAAANIALEGDSELDAVSNLASVLSRVIPKQMESMDAAQLRARWEELIDALEKERLGLPKIKTSSRKMGTNSPRDSGGVKRVAEQMKIFKAPVQHQAPKEKPDEDVSMTRGRPLWSKVEQKQEVVF